MAWQKNAAGVYYDLETGEVSPAGSPPPGYVGPQIADIRNALADGGIWNSPDGTYSIIGGGDANTPNLPSAFAGAPRILISGGGSSNGVVPPEIAAAFSMAPQGEQQHFAQQRATYQAGEGIAPSFMDAIVAAGSAYFGGSALGGMLGGAEALPAGVGGIDSGSLSQILGNGAYGPGGAFAPGMVDVMGGTESAMANTSSYPFGVGPEPTGIGTGSPLTTAGGVADTGYGANTVPYADMNGAGVTAPYTDMNGAGVLSSEGSGVPFANTAGYPNYAEQIANGTMDYGKLGAELGAAGFDTAGVASGAASVGAIASLAKSLGISEASAKSLLGTLGGAVLGSTNGSKVAGTTTTTTDIPEWQKTYATDILNKGQTLTKAAPQDFSQSDALLKSVMAGTANPYSQQDNPYFEKTLNLALNDTTGRVNNQFRNSAFGGSANQELLSRNLGDQSNNLRFGQYKNAQDLYTTDLNRATNVATGMPQYAAQKTQSNFQPLLNQKSLLGFGGSQTSSPYFTNPAGGALYGGLLGSQLFGGK